MRKALLICYYFPPMGMGGIGRPMNLFRHLPEYGWDCHVLTVKPVAYRAFEPELLQEMDQAKIFRAGSHDPQRILYLLGMRQVKARAIASTRRFSERFFPDSKVGWVGPAVRLGRKLFARNTYDCIVSTAPPVSVHLVASRLCGEFGSPWVADFRDYWTAYKAEESFSSQHKIRKAQQLLIEIGQSSSALTSVNRTISDYLGGAEIIFNGYNSSLAKAWCKPPDGNHFAIGLLGHQLESLEVEKLFDILTLLRNKYLDDFRQVRLIQVGQVDPQWLRSLMAERGLEVDIEFFGRQPRAVTVDILSQVHLFYFGVAADKGADFLPGKTFDLLASGRPIIVSAPEQGEVWRILSGCRQAHFMQQDQLPRTVDFLHRQILSWRDDDYRFEPLSDKARQYSSETVARSFASLMERLA